MNNALLLFMISLFFICCKGKTGQKNENEIEPIKLNDTESLLTLKQKVINLGSVKSGEHVQGNFVIYNNGKTNLIINYINPDCTCTGYSISKNVIAPKDSASLTLDFDTTDKAGLQKLTAVINSNTKSKFHKIQLKMFVE